ncbi:23S rRNA (cytidine1920-2'-O)/16S rRNA (cytidine1409-2'-O)-methyltransferase [Azonexus fungiphilus]|uniref:23S rRNA (Cytidine1920-2'-O)/16S rRNA (Cytidine1409-2'-O)-methyltransferase n=1 Tax=Azonexus fungiphilus TaxID=146940 RepID=A0A495WCZ4_9RHOO|nr:TlyA family RNA methyltransferase [Azonexus fungiphilus]RKT58615.1 23S rRNA (cytidine1920-2'-O)/16S rRNA (cytidine1409-2'-O)-methyltransferase [Azonexus fungiphilus]
MSMNSFHARQGGRQRDEKPVKTPVDRHGLLRADALLVQRGLAASRTQAQRLIGEGRVLADGKAIAKPSLELPADASLSVVEDESDRYVSRGGLKLAGALAHTGLAVAGRTCLDVGQSTGGFTDCLLQAGAAQVVGVDVGHGQLHAKLKNDGRVSALEGINCRALTAADLGDAMPAGGFDLIVGDVSFISMTLVLPQLPALLAADGDLLLLIKPQFEVGPHNIGKGGIVRDPSLYREVEGRFLEIAKKLGLTAKAWLDSPITGGDGNREFFIWLKK